MSVASHVLLWEKQKTVMEMAHGLKNMKLWYFVIFLLITGCGSKGKMEEDYSMEESYSMEGSHSMEESLSREEESTVEEFAFPEYLVHITAGTVNGSGVLYSMEDHTISVLTAAHMAVHAPEAGGAVTLTFCDGWETESSDIVISELADLAMIRISAEDITPERLELYQCVQTDKESFDQLQTEDYCQAVGCAGEKEAVRSEGSILEPWIYMEDYSQYMIWADAEIQPGMSGGGLFDKEGRFIGILSGGSEDGELAAVPFSLVLQFLMSMGSAAD